MARPKQIPPRVPLTFAEIQTASYMGSAEHKAARWWGGIPAAYVRPDGVATRPKKQLTTICPMVTFADQIMATGWVRDALIRRQFRYYEGDKTYPKHIWYRDNSSQYWFGFCINGVAGTYKGWPVEQVEKRAIFG